MPVRTARRLAALALVMTTATVARAQAFDHAPFDALLRKHVVNGMVNYDAFKAAPEFGGYLKALAATDPATLARDEQLAFWINAYNAYTIQLIIAHGETESIRNINKTLFLKLKGPWAEPLATVGGKAYTLDDIEHRIIRPTYKEPRIHFALVCAAMGCPPLRSEAYTGARLGAQLDDQGAQFILKSPGKNRVDVASRTLYHSMIFGYYKEDFGGSVKDAAKFMARWYPDGPEKQLLLSGDFKAVQTEYDWTLNSQANAKKLAQR
ncbi:MAG: DUF547 domain-containing protein [Gemmatimonadetes bacterium]|nr:DUF547 domain-containing protein [Gemmatimonadota bacterium]